MIALNTHIQHDLFVKDVDGDGLVVEVPEGRVWMSHEQLDKVVALSKFVRSINESLDNDKV